MNKINISLGTNQSLALSESRIRNFLDGNNAAAQKMGLFDTFKDTIFHGGAKKEALQQLAREFEDASGLDAFGKFERLAQYAAPADRSQFTISRGGTFETPILDYRIKNTVVKQDQIDNAQWKVMETRMGHVTGLDGMKGDHVANWLAQYERDDLAEARQQVQDSAFNEGGVHKRFDGKSGVLRAEDRTGGDDFDREKVIANLADQSESLARYVSTQKLIEPEKMKELLPNIQSDKKHATVTLYNKAHVTGGELDTHLGSLTAEQAHSVLMQTVDMARVFYQHGVSHQDLHMHNMMVRIPTNPKEDNITLEVIDFGKSKVGVQSESDRLNDVRYLFHKQASSGRLETMRRDAREYFNYDMDKQAKHYPLHKLMVQCAKVGKGGENGTAANAFDESIRDVGNRLVSQLQDAENLPQAEARAGAIDEAFNQAMDSLSAITDQLSKPRLEGFYIRC